MGFFIPASRRTNLRKYKYAGEDKSLLSKYLLTPYWNWLVEWVPASIAPNLITLTGLAFVFVNFLTLLWFLPGLTCTPKPLIASLGGTWDPLFTPSDPLRHTEVGWTWATLKQGVKGIVGKRDSLNIAPEQTKCPSRWLYLSWAIGLWIYQSLDAIDGKQARKTKTSGPLGEMFDHGCDALNTTVRQPTCGLWMNLTHLGSWKSFSLLQQSTSAKAGGQTATLANFYLTTWEEYNTHVLYLSVFSGPVEGILMIVLIYLITSVKGPAFWDQGILTFLGLSDIGVLKQLNLKDLPLNDCFLVFGAVGLLFNIISSSRNVINAKRKRNEPILESLLGLLPFACHATCHILWLSAAPHIRRGHLIAFSCYWGVSFAYSVGLLITAHVTLGPFPYWNGLMVWSAVCAADACIERWLGLGSIFHSDQTRSLYLVYASLLIALATYAFFVYDVVGDVCDFFDINCLTIKRRPEHKQIEPAVTRASARRKSGRA